MINVDSTKAPEIASEVSKVFNVELKDTMAGLADLLSKSSENPLVEDCIKAMQKVEETLNDEALPKYKAFYKIVGEQIPELKSKIDGLVVNSVKDHSTSAKMDEIDIGAVSIG